MSGTMIDLMPTAIRRRARAGQRMRRFGGLGVLVLGVIVTFATHSQLRRDRLDEDLVIAQARAAQALNLERQASDMSVVRSELETYLAAYDRVALPMGMDAIIDRIVSALPASGALEQLVLEYEDAFTNRRGRRGDEDAGRQIVGGLTGFAISDDDVAGLVQRLDQDISFEDVRLDYTRSRDIRGVAAREFQLTFLVDLDARWDVRVAEAPHRVEVMP